MHEHRCSSRIGGRQPCARPTLLTNVCTGTRACQARQRLLAAPTAVAPTFEGQGQYATATLPVIKVPLGISPADPSTPLELQLEMVVPQGLPAPAPLVLFSAGFLLNSSLYRSYAARLASWGCAVLLWDLSEVLDDTMSVAYMRQALDVCSRDAQLAPRCDCSQLLLMGHSRGAKLSCLLADQDMRVRGLCLLDPVDSSSFGPSGVGYPSALPALSRAAARRVPTLVLGAALNKDVVPPEANWSLFARAAAVGGAPAWEVVLSGAGHLQFLDRQAPLFSLFSTSGPTPDEDVRRVSQACIVAFTQLALLPLQPPGSQVAQLLAAQAAALRRTVPLESRLSNWGQEGPSAAGSNEGRSAATAAKAAGMGGSSHATSSNPSVGGWQVKPVRASPAELRGMRVGELKRLLQEHGVESSDCFEKEELVQRVLQRCVLVG